MTTLTKREEDLEFSREAGVRVEYLPDIDAIERVEILRNLRQGDSMYLSGSTLPQGPHLPELHWLVYRC